MAVASGDALDPLSPMDKAQRQREAVRRYRAKNPDKVRASNAASKRRGRKKDPEKAREYARQWRADNSDKRRNYDKRYYAANAEARCEYQRVRRIENPEKFRDYDRVRGPGRKYGLTPEEVEALRRAQDDKCRICRRQEKLVIDHCHTTGRVRGMLCFRCNNLLGLALDDCAILDAAMDYLGEARG
jgi:hypothetical protein